MSYFKMECPRSTEIEDVESNRLDFTKKSREEESNRLDFTKKHPLQYPWDWWFYYPTHDKAKPSASSWSAHLRKIYTFCTVEDFWCLWNNIKAASDLMVGSNYHVFRDGIQPAWEDEVNKNGGKWTIALKNSQRESHLNQMWMWAVLACIGNAFSDDDEICGVVVSLRKGLDKISLWTKTASDEQKTKRIGQKFKELLGYQGKIQYQVHSDAQDSKSNSYKPALYEV